MMAAILALSAVIWYLIDRFKPLWANFSWGKYVTMAIAIGASFAVCFGFELDLLFALDIRADISAIGKVITSLTLASGSSAVSEIIARLKGQN